MPERLPLKRTLANLPPEWPEDPLPAIRGLLNRVNRKLVVLDDDPTGSQAVRGIPVLTGWSVDELKAELSSDLPAFFILTNSRSLLPAQAEALNAEIGRSLAEASRLAGRDVDLVSRSDSTLRGHFPGEVTALAEGAGQDFDAWLLVPALIDAGRFTIDDAHYAAEGDWLVPAGETPYAQDATFGYRASDLREWVEEKTGGRIRAGEVRSISIDDLRRGGPERVRERLLALPHGCVCAVNAAGRRDLEVFTQGLLSVEALGKRYLCRTGPSFVPVRIGLAPYPLLEREDLDLASETGALIVVGSYVPKTGAQVEALLQRGGVSSVEVEAAALLDPSRRDREIQRAAREVDGLLRRGADAVVYTSRELIAGRDARESLVIGQQVSGGLVEILRRIEARPRCIIAKGGITSSDVATQALGVKRALVLGQILPGVSVWQLGPESRYPALPYVVFPGNVGGPEALVEAVEKLRE